MYRVKPPAYWRGKIVSFNKVKLTHDIKIELATQVVALRLTAFLELVDPDI